jgi:hypothetical protein
MKPQSRKYSVDWGFKKEWRVRSKGISGPKRKIEI